MTLDTFFEKFDLFADAPDAVAKMRELVLELAVQGRLTSALPSDGTVPSVIEFRESAAALANSLGLRSPKEVVEEAEPPFDVPSHWRWMALADIGAAQTGTTPSKADHEAFNGDIPFIKPADILPNSIDYSNESLTRHGAESGSRLAPSGSLLMVCIGTIGKCNLIERECAFNQQINSLTPVDAVDSRYLLVAARSRSFQDAAWKKSSSTTIAILNKGKWLSIPIPLPPLAEQKRIVAKVDELMALCDRLEAQQQEREEQASQLARASLARFADAPTPANLDYLFHSSFRIPPSDLRKSILTLAVQGKLVPQDPNDEPAEELLANINQERLAAVKARRISPMKPLPPVEEGEIAYELRPGRALARLIELVMEIQTGPFGSSLHQSDYQVGGTPVINPASLKDGKIVPIDSMAIGPDTLKRLEVFCLKEGDIVMARRGEMGRCAIVTKAEDGWLCGTGSLVLRMPTGMYAPFLALVIGAPEAREYLGGASVGATMQNLNQGILAKMPVGVPPLAEQRRIVAKVEQLMALVDALETQLAASRTTAANLLSALVAELTAHRPS